MTLQQTKDNRRLRNTLRRLGAPILTILFAMLLTVAAWGQTLDKGTYTISNSVSHDNPVGQGMARSYTEETSDVEVNDSGTFVTLGFNNTQYMGDFTVSVGGSKVTYETTTHANNVKKIKFKVPSLSSSIRVGLYVQPMDTTVEYNVTLNEGSLKLIRKAETAVEPVQENTSSNAAGNSTSTNSTSNNAGTSSTSNSTTNNTANNSTSNKTNNTSSGTTNSSQSGTPAKQEQSAAKVPAEQTAASAETVKKTDTAVQKEEVRKEEASAEKASAQEEAAAETLAEADTEETAEEAVKKTDETQEAADQEVLEGQDEVQEEADQEAAESTELENTEAATGNSSMKNILLIVGVLVAAGIIGFVIYLKRK